MPNSPSDSGPDFEDLYLDYIDDIDDKLNQREVGRLLRLKDGMIVFFDKKNYRIRGGFDSNRRVYLSVYDFENSSQSLPIISCVYDLHSKEFLNIDNLSNPKPDLFTLKRFLGSYTNAPLYLYMIDRSGRRD